MRKQRSRMQKKHIQYLVGLITHHIENHPDDLGRWIVSLKIAYRELVTLDNMGIFELDHEPTVVTLDRIYQVLKNEFSRNDIYFPEDEVYFSK